MRRIAVFAALLVAACDAPPSSPSNPESAPVATQVPAPVPSNVPPPPRYVGRWAASADACPTGWWRFWNDEVRTGEGEMRCDILPPDGTSGDERLRTVCQAEGKVAREEWVMTYPVDGTMTVARDGGAPVTLIKC